MNSSDAVNVQPLLFTGRVPGASFGLMARCYSARWCLRRLDAVWVVKFEPKGESG